MENSHYSIKLLRKKHLLLLASKLTEKIPDPRHAKEHSIICEKEKYKIC